MPVPIVAAAAAPGISAGAMTAISAISALAQAGGAGLMGYEQGRTADEEMRLAKRKLLLEQQNRNEDVKRDDARYADTQALQARQMAAQAPGNSLNLLSGISNLRKSTSQPTGVDVLSLLSGR